MVNSKHYHAFPHSVSIISKILLNNWLHKSNNLFELPKIILYGVLYVNRINEHIKIAFAGVGKPKYFSDSRISFKALYFASLIAPKTSGKELNIIKQVGKVSDLENAIDVEVERPILSNKIGGLSGTPIKPVALRCVYEISSKFDIPILGCGGISTWEDAVEFILAGASAVQFGSVMGDHWDEVFSEINNGIEKFMERKGYSTIGEMVGRAKRS